MADELDYFLLVNDETHGPFGRAQLVEAIMSKELPPDTLAATRESGEWAPLSSLIQVAALEKPAPVNFGKTIKLNLPKK